MKVIVSVAAIVYRSFPLNGLFIHYLFIYYRRTFQATVDKRVLTSFSFDDVLQVNSGQNGLKVIVWDAMRLHVFHCMWINHLIAQRANRHVRPDGKITDTKDEGASSKFSRSSLTNRFHVAVRVLSNRSQMTSTGGKKQRRGTRAAGECVNDVLTTFWRHRWSITKQTHGNIEFIRFIQWTEKKKSNLLCRLTVRGLCQFRHFPSHKRYFSSVLLRFVLNLLVDSFSQTLFKVFTCSKQNNSANICRTASPSWRWHLMAIDVKMPSSLSIFAKNSFFVLFKNAMWFKSFWYKVFVHWKLKLLNFLMDSVLTCLVLSKEIYVFFITLQEYFVYG